MALLELCGITKSFGAVTAAQSLDLSIQPGEIHAILGENGAGKSTLMKIIYGVLQADAGTMSWDGQPLHIENPAQARAYGIGMVFQHFSLFETLTVAENVALSSGVSVARATTHIERSGARFGLEIPAAAKVHALSQGERQRVEIIRALMGDPKLIIMDEPTSVLAPTAIPGFFGIVRDLAAAGCAVLFISHKLSEIRTLCHTATVMRRGQIVATVDPTETSQADLARLMIGRDIPHPKRAVATVSDTPILKVTDVTVADDNPFGTTLKDVSLTVHGGEIVGIAGISGNGQQLLAHVLSGEIPLSPGQGDIVFDGRPVGRHGVAERRAAGLAYVPEDRQAQGSVPELSLTENALLTGHMAGLIQHGLIRRAAATAFSERCIDDMDVRCAGTGAEARSLSGGNLQKFIVGRELALTPRLLIAAQPTWGVDIGAAQAIHQKLVDLRQDGLGVLVISDELDDLLEISDRIHVMFRGQLSASIPRAEAREDVIGALMAGSFAEAVAAS
ncbi:MAG: ABC transporter ATP-binding protein [Marinibacterium sp.]|nr:ABC transporter ATP-binding protein [Marinibacterium sp.]